MEHEGTRDWGGAGEGRGKRHKKAALGAKSNGLLQRSTNPALTCLNTQTPDLYRPLAWLNRRHAARREKEDNRCLNESKENRAQ